MALIHSNDIDDILAAYKICSDALDRFRDVVTECIGEEESPGDDIMLKKLRSMHNKTGPEPTVWRDFIANAVEKVNDINQSRRETN